GNAVRQVGFRSIAAGKTGTTSDGHDAWFVGYTPEFVGAVWIGFDKPRPILSNATGGGLAAPVWGRIALKLQSSRSSDGWTAPPGVVERAIDPESGLPLADGCRPAWDDTRTELFLTRFEVEAVCPRRGFHPGRWIADILGRLGIGNDRDRADGRGRRRGRVDDEEVSAAVRELERLLQSRRIEIESDRRRRDEEWLRERRRQRERNRGGN